MQLQPTVEIVQIGVEGQGVEFGQQRIIAEIALRGAGGQGIKGVDRAPGLEEIFIVDKVGLEPHGLAGARLVVQPTVDRFQQWPAAHRVKQLEVVALHAVELEIEIEQRPLHFEHVAVDDAELQVDLVEAILHRRVDDIQLLVDAVKAAVHLRA